MLKVFVDSDVILDVLQARSPFAIPSAKVITLAERQKIEIFTSTVVLLNLSYILGNSQLPKIREKMKAVKSIIKPLACTPENLEQALDSDFKDLEDAVQSSIARTHGLDYIVSRNAKDYQNSKVKALSPMELLDLIEREEQKGLEVLI